ncbi:recombinase family protein [Streptomyces sp. NPDC002825]|uniref:recombinase family protein n=1 Tax=Streptomyces sp. NPDC002825 TaxID=3154666 RepID=UPI003330C241
MAGREGPRANPDPDGLQATRPRLGGGTQRKLTTSPLHDRRALQRALPRSVEFRPGHRGPGDVLCVWKLDRLGRSLIDLVSIVDGLRERGIGFRVLDGALSSVDTTSADGRLFFQIIAAMAEFERSLIKDRTRAGLQAARAQGRTGGRPSVVNEDVLTVARARKAEGESISAIAKALGVSRATLYRHLGESA